MLLPRYFQFQKVVCTTTTKKSLNYLFWVVVSPCQNEKKRDKLDHSEQKTVYCKKKNNNNYLLKVCSIKEKKKNLHISVCCSASSYSKLSKTTSPKVLAKMVNKLLCLETLKICMIISKFCQNVTESENFQLKCKHQAAHCVTQKSIQKECF